MGETVDEDGCTVIEEAETKKEATESSFGINQILILLALSLAGVALVTFKPVRVQSPESSEKRFPVLKHKLKRPKMERLLNRNPRS